MSIEDFTYWAGLVHGEGLREYCENFRRRMFDTAAAVFWMYNDTWPTVRSWTPVDYYLRRTPAFPVVRRAMQPVHVVVAQEKDEVLVFGVNDSPHGWQGRLRYGLFQLAGGRSKDQTIPISVPANASTALARFPMSEWTNPRDTIAFAMLEAQDGSVVARNRLILPRFKELAWAPPQLQTRQENGRAVFESDTFVWGVCLDLDGEELLSDNFFDVWPGIPYDIPWPAGRELRVLHTGNLPPLCP